MTANPSPDKGTGGVCRPTSSSWLRAVGDGGPRRAIGSPWAAAGGLWPSRGRGRRLLARLGLIRATILRARSRLGARAGKLRPGVWRRCRSRSCERSPHQIPVGPGRATGWRVRVLGRVAELAAPAGFRFLCPKVLWGFKSPPSHHHEKDTVGRPLLPGAASSHYRGPCGCRVRSRGAGRLRGGHGIGWSPRSWDGPVPSSSGLRAGPRL